MAGADRPDAPVPFLLLFFFTLVTGPRRSLRLKLSDTRDYEPQIRARLGTTGVVVAGADRPNAPVPLGPPPAKGLNPWTLNPNPQP